MSKKFSLYAFRMGMTICHSSELDVFYRGKVQGCECNIIYKLVNNMYN